METKQEVDKMLDTSCTIEESKYNEFCGMVKEFHERMMHEKHNMNIIQGQLYMVAIEVAIRLTDFVEVLNYIQDEALADEICLDTRPENFTRKELESYKKELIVQGGDDDDDDSYQVGTIDSYDRCFYSMIRFPKSYLYRADWIYKLVVEKEAYKIRNK